MGNNGILLPIKPPKISVKERARLTHQFLTDHPDAITGSVVPYENRNHFYLVKVLDTGSYEFIAKIPVTAGNQAKINAIRKGDKENG